MAFGFPAILASLEEGKLKAKIFTLGQKTIVTEARWAELFTSAGIATDVEPDMQSWLRTHAVGVVVLMSMAVTAYQRGAGLAFTEATSYARALREGLELVAQLGNRATPGAMRLLRVLPLAVVASLLFVVSRTGLVKTIRYHRPRRTTRARRRDARGVLYSSAVIARDSPVGQAAEGKGRTTKALRSNQGSSIGAHLN